MTPTKLRSHVCLVGMLGLVIGLEACSTQSPQIDVPPAVQSAFRSRHPNATPQWEQQPYGYEAVFTEGGMEYEVEWSGSGEWLETEYEVAPANFSQLVINRVMREHPGHMITKYEIEITPKGRFYEVEIEQNNNQIELYFDEQANPAQNANEDA
jgi:Putative beta-lactamase-inhibitor-like, PepSY-like